MVNQSKLVDIPWKEDSFKLIWALLTELEKPKNAKIFLGKKDKKEVG